MKTALSVLLLFAAALWTGCGGQAADVVKLPPVAVISSISPSSAQSGASAVTVTVTGSNFINGAVVRWNGADRATTFVSSTQLSAAISSTDLATAGIATVTVFTPGGGVSNAVTFAINAPVPTVASLSPVSATSGSAAMTLTVNGSNFTSTSVVRWNGSDRTTTFVSSTQLTATITAADLAAPGTPTVSVFTPAPGGGQSGSLGFTVVAPNPVPVTTSISPAAAQSGSAAITLTVSGSNFIPSSVVRWNGSDRTTTYVSSSTLTAAIAASDLATAGTAAVTVFNPTPGGGISGAVNFTISTTPPPPTISALTPNARVLGLPDFFLTVTGNNFLSNSVVRWNGQDRPTTFINSTALTATIAASDAVASGLVNVTVFNPDPPPAGNTSAAMVFTVQNPVPLLNSVSPTAVLSGSGAFTLTVTGTGFVPASVVNWNGAARPTSFVSNTMLTAAIPATDVATSVTGSVSVVNPAPGGGTAGNLFVIVSGPNPVPVLSSLTPSSVTAIPVGAVAPVITLTGTGFTVSSLVRWNGYEFQPSFTSSTQLVFRPPNADFEVGTTIPVLVFNPAPQGGLSNALTFTVNNPSLPVINSVTPAAAIAGDAPMAVALSGSGYVRTSVVRWNGVLTPSTFVNNTGMTIAVPAANLANSGTAQITVENPAPGGGTSTPASFTISARTTNPQPTISSIVSTRVPAGWQGFSLLVNGSGFVASTKAQFDGQDRPTSVLSSGQLRAALSAADLSQPRIVPVLAYNDAPGGGSSNTAALTIASPAPGPAVIDLMSKDDQFIAGNDSSGSASISADGRYVAFSSYARNLASVSAIKAPLIFLRDTCTGAPSGCLPTLRVVSQDATGIPADAPSNWPALSANGRYVAYTSAATNLVAGTVAAANLFLFDSCNGAPVGCVPTTSLVASHSLDYNVGNVSISSDGRYVSYLFSNSAGATTRIVDTCAGATGCTSAEIAHFDDTWDARISANGRYVIFTSSRADLVVDDTNNNNDVFEADLCTGAGAGCTRSISIVSRGVADEQGNDFSFSPAMSTNGRFVVFSSWATNLVADDAQVGHQVYLRDTCVGALGCTPATYRISVADDGTQVRSGGPATGGSSVTDDGRYVVFGSNKSGLVPFASGFQTYLRDTCIGAPAGCIPSTTLVSKAFDGTPADGYNSSAAVSGDGRFGVFLSDGITIAPGIVAPNFMQVYLFHTARP